MVSLAVLVLLAVASLRVEPARVEKGQTPDPPQATKPEARAAVVVLPSPPEPPSRVQAVRVEPPEAVAGEASSDSKNEPQVSPENQPVAVRAKSPVQATGETETTTPEPEEQTSGALPTFPEEITVDRQAVQEGRVLLVMLAEGKGPNIEIAWPNDGKSREKLYRLLSSCYGMKSAILRGNGELFIAEGKPGKPWEINRDYYSSLLREPRGRVAAVERRAVERIEAYHGVRGTAVRVLPRVVDAGIVGALFGLSGSETRQDVAITAHYDFDERGLVVSGISVAGRPIRGTLRVPRIIRNCPA